MRYQTKKTSQLLIIMSIFISTFFFGCEADQPLLEEVGVASYTFRNQFSEDVPGTLDMIKEMGITNIEFSSLFDKTSEELRALLDERGMICTSFGVGYEHLMDNTEQVIADAKNLGADFVRVAWIPHDGEAGFAIEDAKKAVEDFNRVGKILNEDDIMFCYHNHGYEFQPYEDETLFDYIVQNTNPEYVGFQMDIFWVAYPGADPVEYLGKYPKRFWLMHLKDLKKGVKGDFSGSNSDKENDVVLGTGQIDIPAVLAAAKETNIRHYYIEDETEDVIQRVPQSLSYLKGLTLADVAAYLLVHETIGRPGRY